MYDGMVVKGTPGFYRDYGQYSVRTSAVLNTKNYYVDYGHLQANVVTIDQTVKAGQMVGYMGKLGSTFTTATPTHVHIAVWRPISFKGYTMGFVRPWF